MTYRINVTAAATSDVQEIEAGLEEFSPAAAKRVLKLLENAMESLADFPKRYVLAPESRSESTEIRQMIVSQYRILFRVIGESVHILRVRHAAQQQMKPGELN